MKAALALAFVVALTVPLDQLEGKGMAFRFPLFMLSAAAVPLAWRRRFRPYPSTADVLVVAPFLLDTLGNLVGFYDAYDATDDVLHTLNWVLLVAAFHAWRYRRGPSAGLQRSETWWGSTTPTTPPTMCCTPSTGCCWWPRSTPGATAEALLRAPCPTPTPGCWGQACALAIVGWEIAEWIVAETGAGGGLALTYGDTVGDLTLSTAGGMAGSWLGVRFLGDRRQLSGSARLS